MGKLAVLEKTHFDYHPKVLTEVLVKKTEMATQEEHYLWQYDHDLALVIHLGLSYPPFAVNY
jgi:hypothetical protein